MAASARTPGRLDADSTALAVPFAVLLPTHGLATPSYKVNQISAASIRFDRRDLTYLYALGLDLGAGEKVYHAEHR